MTTLMLDDIKTDTLCEGCRSEEIRTDGDTLAPDGLCDLCATHAIYVAARERGSVKSIADLALIPPPRPFIRGTLMQKEVSVLVGAPGSWKSFLALDWALTIASDTKNVWLGRKVVEHAPVLYVTNEGASGLYKRVKAWGIAWRTDLPQDFAVLIPDEPLWSIEQSKPVLTEVIAVARSMGAKLVVFDTLSSLFGGIGENGAEDVSIVTNRLAAIRNNYGIASLVLHHSPKANPEDARGSGAIKGNTDLMVTMVRNGSNAVVKTAKVKDHADWAMRVTTTLIEVGEDEEGEVLTSLVLAVARDTDEDKPLKTRVLDAIPESPESVTTAQVLAALGLGEGERTQVARAIKRLCEVGAVAESGKSGRSPLYQRAAAE